MAKRRKPKQRGLEFDVTGVTINQLINMDFRELQKYNEASVKKITSRLVSAMNKRYRRLGASQEGQMSPTYQWFEKRERKGKGFYSVKGKGKSTTISLFKTLQEKLQQQTSTIKGYREFKRDLYKDLKLDFKNNLDLEKKFWEVYNKYTETEDKTTENWKTGGGSPQVMQYILNQMGDWENMTSNQKQEVITKLYEDLKITEAKEKAQSGQTESSFFQNGDEFEDEGEY